MKKIISLLVCFGLWACQSVSSDPDAYEPPVLKRNVYRYVVGYEYGNRLFYKNDYYSEPLYTHIMETLNPDYVEDISYQGPKEARRYVLQNHKNKIGLVSVGYEVKSGNCPSTLLWALPSFLTLTLINLTGYPTDCKDVDFYMDASVYDNNRNFIKKYDIKKTRRFFNNGYYYIEYRHDDIKGQRLQESILYKEALNEILLQIDNDDDLYNKLNAPNRKKAEKIERKKREKEEQAEQEKKHLQDVLKEMENL